MISFEKFDAVYHSCVSKMLKKWSINLQNEISRHNAGWHPSRFSLTDYFRSSSIRFYNSYSAIANRKAETVCDIGCLGGVFPLVMNKLGYNVSVTETLPYYSSEYLAFLDYHASQGISIIDYDPFGEKALGQCFDVVYCLAVLEHYPHSLAYFVRNFREMIASGGYGYIEVPLITYFFKRINLLRGISPLASIELISKSEVPFTGHHHEYTFAELYSVARMLNLPLVSKHAYTYSYRPFGLAKMAYNILTSVIPTCHEIGAILIHKE